MTLSAMEKASGLNVVDRKVMAGSRSPFLFLLLLLFLSLPSCAGPDRSDWSGAQVVGVLTDEAGSPVADAHVYAYREDKANTLGPADAMSEPTGEDGVYTLVLPAGTYTLVARRRLSGSISGPLRNGDLSGQVPRPVRLGAGGLTGLDITLRVFKQGSEGDPKRILTTHTRITGTVTDPEGRSLAGAHVFAYRGAFRTDPPDYLAPPSDREGRFEISLPGGGSYTIGARTGLRGKPRPEDSLGFWGDRDRPREIGEGTVTEGVKIVVKPYGDTETR